MTQSHYHVLRTHVRQELPQAPRRSRAPWVVGGALLVLAAAGSAVTQSQLRALLTELDGRSLERAEVLLERTIQQQKTDLLAEVGILADDTRVRTTVMTPEFNEATVRDVLEDLRRASGARMMAMLDPAGRVQAVSGADSLRGVDLGSVPVVRQGMEQEAANVWTFPDQLLVVGLAPVRSGDQVLALFMVGREVGKSMLAPIQGALGTSAAVLIGDQIASATRDDEAVRAVARAAAGLELGRNHRVPGTRDHLVRITAASQSGGAGRIMWMIPLHEYGGRVLNLQILAWLPVVLVALALVASTLVARRKGQADTEVA
jgi:hypothetical protein